ncbi:class I SAM-dependent methyltransferase [Mycolicibacterium flavescens]|uniref:SAM-dependent methyltransferase n=1 Tax=Mycolicibacterium flavescens TaxID=1776 RepID=A0A1E3RM32_MYCFV|nr:class I SAM-dependent methyltransferase [Mycolicibacterium flavescens]MCV7278966.1 class I SAM-dependent methyltransferase [Mycolicibacterium flavescens]ODQ90467.1 SAM-dependent methyltransferase [Mycolicibacterium flavescens]
MTKYHPATHHVYLPAAGHDLFLPGYDLLTRVFGFNRAYRTLIDQAGLRPGLSVLEVGCGTGNLIVGARRAEHGIRGVGCDPDPRALARAERKARSLSGLTFDRAYAQELPYGDGEFDRVLSSMMWHHLDENVKPAAAQEFFRVLRPGGSLHLVDIGGEVGDDGGVLARRIRRSAHAAGNLGDAIPRRLSEAGFECRQVGTRRIRLVGPVAFFRAIRPE